MTKAATARVRRLLAPAVPETSLPADPDPLFEACHCCGVEPIGDRDGVRCPECSARWHAGCRGL